jgi:hypothetical protein
VKLEDWIVERNLDEIAARNSALTSIAILHAETTTLIERIAPDGDSVYTQWCRWSERQVWFRSAACGWVRWAEWECQCTPEEVERAPGQLRVLVAEVVRRVLGAGDRWERAAIGAARETEIGIAAGIVMQLAATGVEVAGLDGAERISMEDLGDMPEVTE